MLAYLRDSANGEEPAAWCPFLAEPLSRAGSPPTRIVLVSNSCLPDDGLQKSIACYCLDYSGRPSCPSSEHQPLQKSIASYCLDYDRPSLTRGFTFTEKLKAPLASPGGRPGIYDNHLVFPFVDDAQQG